MVAVARPFDLVIFDCDGVLVDSETISASTLADNLNRIGFQADLDYVNEYYLGRSFSVIEADYLRRTRRPLPQEFADAWYQDLFAAFRRDLKPITGVADVLRRPVDSQMRCLIERVGASGGLFGGHWSGFPLRSPHLQRNDGAPRQTGS